jgi:hypothetical protein
MVIATLGFSAITKKRSSNGFLHMFFLLFLIKKAGTAVCGCLHLYDHFLFPVLSAVSFCFCRAA